MQTSAVILVVTLGLAALTSGQQLPSLGARDISQLLKDSQLVKREIDCVLQRAACDRLGKSLMRAIPEVITNKCRRCTPTQLANVNKLKAFLHQNYPGVWEQVESKYSKA
ncbi:ejaculatory bulb-specific protein 3-like [Schistocerca gregaria]|uniref:ejaculatory bulb-specific protein 3-like n=1 Tax=Schistocerca gregaria TaxID=7010 RepID=UPI00211E48FD|nr:ejaculatory bulb-specific protein 3-like [Schistocerca gregaria]